MIYSCPRCLHYVPPWFIETLRAQGGAFYVPSRDAGIFDNVEWSFEGNETPEFAHKPPTSGINEAHHACYHCTSGWPYPSASECEDDYVERLRKWRREQEEQRQ